MQKLLFRRNDNDERKRKRATSQEREMVVFCEHTAQTAGMDGANRKFGDRFFSLPPV
jgi:hypothetical protein